MRFLPTIVWSAMILVGCRSSRPGDEHGETREPPEEQADASDAVLEAWAAGHEAAGVVLSSVASEEDVLPALEQAAAGYRASAMTLGVLAEADPAVSSLARSTEELASTLERAAGLAGAGDGLGVGLELEAFARALELQAPSGQDLGLESASTLALEAAGAFAVAHGEDAATIMTGLTELSPDDYRELAMLALELEDPTLRELYGLDDPAMLEGVSWIASGAARDALVELLDDPEGALEATAMSSFVETMPYLGASLLYSAGSIDELPAMALTICDDECSPEGDRRNCTGGSLRITYCGHTPESEDQILEMIDRLPTGQGVARVAVQVLRMTRPVNIYFECMHDECVDTTCVPFIDPELEWENGKTTWLGAEDPQDEGGGDGCWLPRFWDGSDYVRFQRALNEVGEECRC